MQDITMQHNEIMVMIENLQTTIDNSRLLKEITIQPRSGTPAEQTPISSRRVMVVVDETRKEGAKPKQPTTIQTLKEKKSRTYSFLRSKTVQIFEQALKSGLTLPACKRPADIDKADEGEFCSYHRVLGHTIEDCWVFKDLIEEGYKDGTIQLPKSFQHDPALHNSNDKGKGVAYTILYTPILGKSRAVKQMPIKEIYRSNSVMNIEIEEEMAALEITVVRERQ
jgi:hypothetical protein